MFCVMEIVILHIISVVIVITMLTIITIIVMIVVVINPGFVLKEIIMLLIQFQAGL